MRTQIKRVDQLIGTPGKLGLAQEVITAEDAQVFFRRQRFDQYVLLQSDAKPGTNKSQMLVDIFAEDSNGAAGRTSNAVYHAQGRRLACSVWAQKAETSLRWDLQIQIIHSQPLTEFLGNRSCGDNRRRGACCCRRQMKSPRIFLSNSKKGGLSCQ